MIELLLAEAVLTDGVEDIVIRQNLGAYVRVAGAYSFRPARVTAADFDAFCATHGLTPMSASEPALLEFPDLGRVRVRLLQDGLGWHLAFRRDLTEIKGAA